MRSFRWKEKKSKEMKERSELKVINKVVKFLASKCCGKGYRWRSTVHCCIIIRLLNPLFNHQTSKRHYRITGIAQFYLPVHSFPKVLVTVFILEMQKVLLSLFPSPTFLPFPFLFLFLPFFFSRSLPVLVLSLTKYHVIIIINNN